MTFGTCEPPRDVQLPTPACHHLKHLSATKLRRCGEKPTHVVFGAYPRQGPVNYAYRCSAHAEAHAIPLELAPGRPISSIRWDRLAAK